jgi:hypothetical protein
MDEIISIAIVRAKPASPPEIQVLTPLPTRAGQRTAGTRQS